MKVAGGSHARDHTYVYDTSNRLGNIKNTVGGATVVGLGYDEQGNLANKNGQGYDFDFGNRLREVAGKERYLYGTVTVAGWKAGPRPTRYGSTACPGR